MVQSKEQYNSYMRAYHLKQYHAKRRELIKLHGGKCTHCGTIDRLAFDHVNPKTKKDTIGKLWAYGSKTLNAELLKCQLLCRRCHIKKSVKNKETGGGCNKITEYTHGHWKMYSDGCRCDVCSEWKRQSRKNTEARKKKIRSMFFSISKK